jgi:hypothetical protein
MTPDPHQLKNTYLDLIHVLTIKTIQPKFDLKTFILKEIDDEVIIYAEVNENLYWYFETLMPKL